ncbi:MAG: isoprenylcysteine carboxylmethyltransferase family protein [bacterium]|nr:isoprenylcysteine carboxylmethyltransferase family protein [bacterium]
MEIYKTAKKYRTRLSAVMAVLFLVLARPTASTLLWGLILIAAGQTIRIWSSGYIHKNEVLTVTGPYSLSRNPLYVGSFLMGMGFVVCMGVPWLAMAFLLFFAGVYWFTIRWEEDKLERFFSEQWDRYRSRVPRFFPLLRWPGYRRGPFDLSQVVRNKEMLNATVVATVYGVLWIKALTMN